MKGAKTVPAKRQGLADIIKRLASSENNEEVFYAFLP